MNSRRIIGQVHEQSDSIQTTVLLEVLLEESGCLHVDSHGTKNDGEIIGVTVMNTLGGSRSVNQTRLTTDLSSNLHQEAAEMSIWIHDRDADIQNVPCCEIIQKH
jgi:hypothetical protein